MKPLGSDSIHNLFWKQSVFSNSAQQYHFKSEVNFGIVHERRGVPKMEPLGIDFIYNLFWQQSVFLNSAQQDLLKAEVKFGIAHGRRK